LLLNPPPAGRLALYLQNWKILTQDLQIIEFVQEYQIPLVSIPTQKGTPHPQSWGTRKRDSGFRECFQNKQ